MKRFFTNWSLIPVTAIAFCLSQGQVTAQELPSADGVNAVAPIEGDYNFNGVVEQADLDLVLLNWGEDVAVADIADWTNDPPSGRIDQAELDRVLLNWGNRAGAAVPEPGSSLLLLAGASAAWGVFRWRKARG